MSKRNRIGLVASVSSQPSSPSPAIDLYRSADFLAARRRVESACESWFVLSPRYHLVAPGDWLEPYEETVEGMSVSEREAWSAQVLEKLEERLGDLKGKTFEIHATPEFYEHGLLAGLSDANAKITIGGEKSVAEPKAKAPEPVAAPAAPARQERRERSGRAPRIEVPVALRRKFLDELYGLVDEQAEVIGGRWSLPDCSGDDHWPQHGVIFFFEPGEFREDGTTPKIVRVETHALTPNSKIRLWDRLRSDRGAIGGANPGSGNHRASALRRQVGRALIARDGFPEAAASWGSAGRIPPETKKAELPLEIAVSQYIAKMEFVWMEVPRLEDRLAIELGGVSLLSNFGREPIDPPSPDWLGHHGGDEIANAGIWNVEHVEQSPRPEVLDLLRRHLV